MSKVKLTDQQAKEIDEFLGKLAVDEFEKKIKAKDRFDREIAAELRKIEKVDRAVMAIMCSVLALSLFSLVIENV